MLDVVRHGPRRDGGDQRVGHAVGDLFHVGERDGVAAVPGKAGALGVMLSRRIEAHDLAVLDHLQAAADMHGGGGDHLAVLDQAELCGAAADIDVEDALVLVAGNARGAGAVGRQHRFHVMAGGGGDEFAALLGQDLGDALRVLAAQRLAGQNDHAGVDIVGMQIGGVIGVVDDGAELFVVDALLALIGRQRHRRLEQGLARDDVIAAGQILGQPAQIDARENDLRARRADVDADRHQRDVVLAPERIVFAAERRRSRNRNRGRDRGRNPRRARGRCSGRRGGRRACGPLFSFLRGRTFRDSPGVAGDFFPRAGAQVNAPSPLPACGEREEQAFSMS